MAQSYPLDQWLLFAPGREPLAEAHRLTAHANVQLHRHRLPGRALFGAAALAGVPRLDRLLGGRLDVLWAPAPAPLALSSTTALVLTVHDLSFEQRRHDFTPYERLWHSLARPRRLAERASAIIVDAGPTRDELLRRWGIDPGRVTVIHPGVSRPPAPVAESAIGELRRRRGLPERFLLCVGALEPRKAPELLMRAHAAAREQGLDVDLVFAGAGRLAKRLGGPGVHVLGYVAPAELEELYVGALALVMPSFLEGYGLPPLEAIARGTPALVSDLAVYDDTLKDGALRVAVGDERALTDALIRISGDEPLRARLVASGRRAIGALSWEQAAARTYEVLKMARG
jgi:glycosyltransferase involved in cell wall biosynthesis